MFDRIIKMFIAASLVVVPLAGAAKDYVVKSPSGNLVLKVATGKNLTWQVNFKGHEITAPSVLSVKLKNGGEWGSDNPGGKQGKVSRTIDGVNYRKAKIEDKYTLLMLKGKGYSVEFRAYDDAAAYRFIANASDSVTIENEKVEYNFTKDYEAYVPYVNDLRHGERSLLRHTENFANAPAKPCTRAVCGETRRRNQGCAHKCRRIELSRYVSAFCVFKGLFARGRISGLSRLEKFRSRQRRYGKLR